MSDLQFPDPSFQELYDELNRTGVLSQDWKNRLVALLLSGMQQAYERGRATTPEVNEDSLRGKVKRFIVKKQRIQAIKLIRQQTGWMLKDAKEWLDRNFPA